jgi:TonB family protein
VRRNSRNLIPITLLVAFSVVPIRPSFANEHHFVPPDVRAASDIPYPLASLASGVVTLSINLNAAGRVQNVQILRDVPSLTNAAVTGVESWTFVSATLDGVSVPSTLNVSVVFNPANLQTQTLTLVPVQPTPPPNPPGYLPPEIAAAFYAHYPTNSTANGAVVLNVTVDKAGEIKSVSPIRSVPSLTSAAIGALNGWTVNAATFEQKAINSRLIVAFVFRAPT